MRTFFAVTLVLSLIGSGLGVVAAVGLASLSVASPHGAELQAVRHTVEQEAAKQATERNRLIDAQKEAVDAAKAEAADRLALMEQPLLKRLRVVEAQRDRAVVAVAQKQAELASLVRERDHVHEQERPAREDIAKDGQGDAMGQLNSPADAMPVISEPLKTITNSIGMKFVEIPAGTFSMGSASIGSREVPVHEVTISRSFFLGVYEVTNANGKAVKGFVPSKWKEDNFPVDSVTWDEAAEFCEALSAMPAERRAGRVYRLPTEAEWEYACRAGTTTAYSFGDDPALLGDFAWFDASSRQQSHPVGQKRPNGWGLFDMHGNVSEWCSDWAGGFSAGVHRDPRGPLTGELRILRGGSWNGTATHCLSATRGWLYPSDRNPNFGFRIVLSHVGATHAKGAVDVLSTLDLRTAPQAGGWRMENGSLLLVDGQRSQVALPVRASDRYNLVFTVERLDSDPTLGINLGLIVGRRRVGVVIDGGSNPHKYGLETVDGKGINDPANPTMRTGTLLPIGRPRVIACFVRGNELTVTCDGAEIISWKSDPSRLGVHEYWQMPGVGITLGGQRMFRFSNVVYTRLLK